MTWTEDLTAWSSAPLAAPDPARRAAVRHLLDGLGCAAGAAHDATVPYLDAVVASATAPQEATVLGGDRRVPAHVAALANGTLVHALDFDDTHAGGLVHATAVVLPTAFAVGEQVGADGRTVLDAALVGYETVTRLAAAVPHGFHRRGFHATSVAGVFAAALVAARLRGLDGQRTVAALGIAGSMASGSLAFLAGGAATKQLHPGWAASAGIQATTLAAGGATGPVSILEDPDHGFYRAYTDTVPEAPFTDLGRVWQVEQLTIKPYPVCQLAHASIDAARAIAVDPADVVAVHVTVHPDVVDIVCEPAGTKARPRTPYEARFSLAWCVAAALHDGAVTLDTVAGFERPELTAVAAVTTYEVADPGVPAADAPGHVRVELRDGRTVTGDVAHSRGGPSAPLTDAELTAKATTNGVPPDVVDAVLQLDTLPDLTEVLR